MLYAAKIAAAELHAPKKELAAILAALRAEERATLNALREGEQMKAQRRRQVRLAWTFGKRGVDGRSKPNDAIRPYRHHRVVLRRDRAND